ncbi:hypothetical protein H6P81_013637 [Aristolochia fimbriata]|uniref:FCP1 homology domain-containing protein n=1 Tax=Aristolochia fimbriata TaxID=158543 RepID=A0AAV7EFQ9_ARIFI|nr:hypothetical protein H6P81_013637 [Aristolochia fimbriata]
MPAPMKSKPSISSLSEGRGLHPCRQSIKISKSSRFDVKMSQQAVLEPSVKKHEDVSCWDMVSEEFDYEDLLSGANLQYQSPITSCGSSLAGRSGLLSSTCSPMLETIFSPTLELDDVHSKPLIHNNSDTNIEHLDVTHDERDDGGITSSNHLTSDMADFSISDIGVSNLDFDENSGNGDSIAGTHFPDYEFAGRNVAFELAEGYMILPFLEESMETSHTHDGESAEEAVVNSDDACLYLAIQQVKPSHEKINEDYCSGERDEVDGFDPHLFLRNLPELSEVVPAVWPMLLPKETRKTKPVTLVLDLDETLVHSTLDYCEDADFTFSVYFNMKEHTVYVRQRPHLRIFLERVAELFEVIVFTASQSIYAAQLLDKLDPDKQLISRRVYRESCIFFDGSYMKDLTVLGLDLAKVAIIDNSPQVFRLQVNNGIPIQSWFDDPSDCALIQLIPFLETLAEADDVRPIIANRFNNNEQ